MTDTRTELWRERAAESRAALAADPHRPVYHFTAPRGWLNDPNGLIQWRGEYHLFYQHNPLTARWGPPHWGHTVSRDLVHWRDRPVALTPDMPPADDGGCWSGCAVMDGGTPTFVYTGVKKGEQTTCLAFGDDMLTTWRKYEGNPVQGTPGDLGITHASYRDPYVWRENGAWYSVVGTSIGGRGQVLLYRSSDLRRWEYLNPLLAQDFRSDHFDESHTWECPNFCKLGDKHVLVVSLATHELLAYPIVFVGDFKDDRFYPERQQRMDGGYHGFYAPLSMQDGSGRRLMWGWLQEQRSAAAQLNAGWSGVMSLPRVLSLEGDTLRTSFAPELRMLRGEEVRQTGLRVSGTCETGVTGHALEFKLRFQRGSAARSGLTLRHGEDEATRLVLDWAAGTLTVDKTDSSLSPEAERGNHVVNLGGDSAELHLYLDHSVLEAILDGRQPVTTRVYPERPGAGGAELFAEGGEAVVGVEAWPLSGIW